VLAGGGGRDGAGGGSLAGGTRMPPHHPLAVGKVPLVVVRGVFEGRELETLHARVG